jgi:hypothetical protein
MIVFVRHVLYFQVSSFIELRLEYSMKFLYHYNREHTEVVNSIQSQVSQ